MSANILIFIMGVLMIIYSLAKLNEVRKNVDKNSNIKDTDTTIQIAKKIDWLTITFGIVGAVIIFNSIFLLLPWNKEKEPEKVEKVYIYEYLDSFGKTGYADNCWTAGEGLICFNKEGSEYIKVEKFKKIDILSKIDLPIKNKDKNEEDKTEIKKAVGNENKDRKPIYF